jgi:hypothetical protein
VEPETLEPEFEKAPSRSLMIMARIGEWNECLLQPFVTFQPFNGFNHPTTHHPGEPSRSVAVTLLNNPG